MLDGLKDFTVKMIAGANVATIVFMLLVGYSDLLNPAKFPAFTNAGFPAAGSSSTATGTPGGSEPTVASACGKKIWN